MKKRMSKLLSYLLVMVMLLSSSLTAMAEGDNTVVSGNDIIENEITDDTSVSDNEEVWFEDAVTSEVETEEESSGDEGTVSGNEEAAEEDNLFPGLPDGYKLSAQAIEDKKELAGTLDELEDLNAGTDYVEDEVFFICNSREDAELYAEAYGAELKSYHDNVGVITLPEKATVYDAVKAASSEKTNLPVVSPNFWRYAMDTDEEIVSLENYNVSAAAYNDPMLSASSNSYQWHHQVVGSTYAWNNGYKGKGVKVAVLDTGVSTHEDLTIVGSYNAAAGATSGTGDENGHGTHVAGIIAAKNNNSKGGSGIAPEVTLYNIKVLGENDEQAGTSATLVAGINKAVNDYKVDIINMSLGGPSYSVLENQTVSNATANGVAVFVAAGNDYAMSKAYPAAYPDSICVAATDTNNSRAYFSNYGSWVDLSAPGVNIYSTIPGGYGIMSGTSQATPVVAGTAAVILSSDHKELKDSKGVPLTGAAKVAALKKIMTGNVIKATGTKIGKGITSLPKALKLSTIATNPNQPVFKLAGGEVTKGGTYKTKDLAVTITAEGGMTIYYTTDGKTPTFKNGVATGTKYTGPVTLSGEVNGKVTGKMTLKAIAVNAAGKVSKATSCTFTFKPQVTAITISGLKEVVAGKSITLKAAVTPTWAANKAVTWSINGDPAKTGVSINKTSGKITAKAKATPGSYTVTATAKDGSGISKTYTVQVLEAAKVNTMAFSLKSTTFERASGKTTLNLSTLLTVKDKEKRVLSNSGNVVWSGNKDTVATIDQNGVLTAKAAGVVTVTATAADGSGKNAKIKVTVVQLAESITISGSSTVARGKSVTLKAVIGPTTTKDKSVTWQISGDPSTTGVSINAKNGKVTATAKAVAGTYTVSATTKNGMKASAQIKVLAESIKTMKFRSSSVNVFRVAGKNNAPTSTTVNLDITGGYDASSLTVTNSAPGVVNASLNGTVLTVSAKEGTTAGKAVITVSATDGSKKSAKCTVNVINPASNITISPEMGRTNFISKGKTLKLSAVMETEYGVLEKNSKKVNWSSSNEAVATVNSSGVVTAKSGIVGKNFGTAVITASAADGSGIVATYEVYTEELIDRLSIGSMFFNATRDTISVNEVPGYAIYCNYSTNWLGKGVSPEVNVEVSNPDIASAWTGYDSNSKSLYLVVYPYKTGTVTIKVKPVDGSKANASIQITVTK